MDKNLILVQNGFPGSNTSGTIIDTLNIRNFFKYEKNVSPTVYYRKHWGYGWESNGLEPYNNDYWNYQYSTGVGRKLSMPAQWYERSTGDLKYNNSFKHYSVSFMLFAVRMKKGYLGTDVTITSRLASDSPLKLKFFNIGTTVEDFQKLILTDVRKVSDYEVLPHMKVNSSMVIPSLANYNHCFLAALFSDSAYELESGTVLLNNEPLLNISWTETEFVEAQ